jgi:hypothetical protein
MSPLNKFIADAEGAGRIVYREMKFYYYQHPPGGRHYIRVEWHNRELPDWEKELVQKGPVFSQTELALSEGERSRRDLADLKRPAEEPNPFILRPSLYGIGIDLPKTWKWLRNLRSRWFREH